MRVLGAMMRDGDGVEPGIAILRSEEFYRPAHRKIFEAIESLYEQEEPVDIVTVTAELERGGKLAICGGETALIDIVDSVFTSANIRSHAKIVHDKAMLRGLIQFSSKLIRKCHDAPGEIPALMAASGEEFSHLTSQNGSGPRNYKATRFSDVEEETVDWLWYGMIPKGKITFLEGKPGVGKSFFSAQIAAIVSKGLKLPGEDGRPSINVAAAPVLIMCAEDTLPDIILPRMKRADADLKNVHLLENTTRKPLSFADLGPIERALEDFKPGLLVIDPLQQYLGAGVDMNRANETRPVLTKVLEMVTRAHVGCLIIRHWRKQDATEAQDRGMGSTDISGIAHCVLAAVGDNRNPKPGETHGVVCLVKKKLTAVMPSLKYGISSEGFFWRGVDDRPVEEICAKPSHKPQKEKTEDTREAREWLLEVLSEKDYTVEEMKHKARGEGVSWRQIEAAKKEAGVIVDRIGGIWVWKIPAREEL